MGIAVALLQGQNQEISDILHPDGKYRRSRMIYFIQSGTGPIKIGFTKEDARARLRDLQCANPEKLHLRAAFEGTRNDEKVLHAKFKHARIRGEWFWPIKELQDVIKRGTIDGRPLMDRQIQRFLDGGGGDYEEYENWCYDSGERPHRLQFFREVIDGQQRKTLDRVFENAQN